MKIQPIVEGHGEVEAVPVLLRRLVVESGATGLDVGRPIRKRRSELVNEELLKKAVRLALLQPECGAVLIVFDCDDDCPKELAPKLNSWAREVSGVTAVAVVLATREFESWFLAALESLRGSRGILPDAVSYESPETIRGAAERLEQSMLSNQSYSKTADQAALTARFDLKMAFRRCRSFQKMTKAFGELAAGAGATVVQWPPASWLAHA